MGLIGFSIIFDNSSNIYHTCQTVTGKIVIDLNSPKKLRGIRIKLKGEANTSLEDKIPESGTQRRSTEKLSTVTSNETYFNAKYYILGSENGNKLEIPAGRHSYPFAFALPKDLPSSFEHKYGHVRYTVEAVLDQPWKSDRRTKVLFTVISDFDLNNEPRASEPLRQVMSKTSGTLWCGSAPLEIVATMPVKGYVPGQTMQIQIHVDNFSGLEVQTIKVMLHKIIVFHAKKPHKLKRCVSCVMAEVSKGPIMTGEDTCYNQELKIPDVPQPNLEKCGIIDVLYRLEIKVRTPGWHRNLKSNNLVFIGTIPLRDNSSSISPSKNEMDLLESCHLNRSQYLTHCRNSHGFPNHSVSDIDNNLSASPTAPPPPAYDCINLIPIVPTNLYPSFLPPPYSDVIWSSENP